MSQDPAGITIKPQGGEAGTILVGNLPACDALIHIVDRVLLPNLASHPSTCLISNAAVFLCMDSHKMSTRCGLRDRHCAIQYTSCQLRYWHVGAHE